MRLDGKKHLHKCQNSPRAENTEPLALPRLPRAGKQRRASKAKKKKPRPHIMTAPGGMGGGGVEGKEGEKMHMPASKISIIKEKGSRVFSVSQRHNQMLKVMPLVRQIRLKRTR